MFLLWIITGITIVLTYYVTFKVCRPTDIYIKKINGVIHNFDELEKLRVLFEKNKSIALKFIFIYAIFALSIFALSNIYGYERHVTTTLINASIVLGIPGFIYCKISESRMKKLKCETTELQIRYQKIIKCLGGFGTKITEKDIENA